MAKDKNRDKVAGPEDLTIQGLYDLACQSSEDLESADTIAADILKVMIVDDEPINWERHIFATSNGFSTTANAFIRTFGNDTPITRTLTNYIQPLIISKATTSPNLGGRVITRSADPKLNFDSVKSNVEAPLSLGCGCC